MTAMVIATGLNGANIPKERRINDDTLFFFLCSNVQICAVLGRLELKKHIKRGE